MRQRTASFRALGSSSTTRMDGSVVVVRVSGVSSEPTVRSSATMVRRASGTNMLPACMKRSRSEGRTRFLPPAVRYDGSLPSRIQQQTVLRVTPQRVATFGDGQKRRLRVCRWRLPWSHAAFHLGGSIPAPYLQTGIYPQARPMSSREQRRGGAFGATPNADGRPNPFTSSRSWAGRRRARCTVRGGRAACRR